jgi:hypothetical protein
MGRPKRGFGVMNASSMAQKGPSTVKFSVPVQSCFKRSVNTPAIS